MSFNFDGIDYDWESAVFGLLNLIISNIINYNKSDLSIVRLNAQISII